jgi:hypothetical protein
MLPDWQKVVHPSLRPFSQRLSPFTCFDAIALVFRTIALVTKTGNISTITFNRRKLIAMSVIVRKVESRADFKAFFEFPWTLYRDDPNWVPPLLSMRRDQLDKQHNPAWSEYLEGDYFAAWRGDQIVGTIVAFISHRHNDYHQERIGWFGMFEVYDDDEAARALLDTAADWVKARGYTALHPT